MSLHDAIHISAGRYMVTSNAYDFLAMLKSHGYIVIPSNPSDAIEESIYETVMFRADSGMLTDTVGAVQDYTAAAVRALHDLA